MTTLTHDAHVETQIRQLVAERDRAIVARNLDAHVAQFADDLVFFDLKPPFQARGAEAYRQAWEQCLPCLPESFGIETRDLRILVGGGIAVAHRLMRLTGFSDDAPQTWVRDTSVYRRADGEWQVVHAHGSVPFDPCTQKAVLSDSV